jgi:signal transduction histidine kinase
MNGTSVPEDRMEVLKLFPCLTTCAGANCTMDIAAIQPALRPRQTGQIQLLQEVQELERQRIAIDLHDGLGPLITLVKLELQNASRCIGDSPHELGLARAAIRRAEENVTRTFDELRRTVLNLRPAMLDDLGILHALGWLIRQFELSGTDAVIQGRLVAEEGAVPVALKIVIFRICQEALNNTMKHAHASHVSVALELTGVQLQLSIVDDGVGFVTAAGKYLDRSAGGLAGIIRRANSSKGECCVDSAAGLGTRVTVRWLLAPLPETAAAPLPGRGLPPAPSIPP